MSATFETKLPTPTLPKEYVERDELVDYLASVTAKLVLVDAAVGFGKTALIAQWRTSPAESRPFAWVSLDPGDNDPGRLWWHVVYALQQACPEFDAGDILRAARVQAPDIAPTLLPLLINELAALPEPVVLVLDDYHVITDRGCHDQVAFLVSHLPQSVQLVLITRADPPLPLASWRAAREMVEVRGRQLRFGPAQAAELMAAAGIELSPADLTDLVDRTEGWPAGLHFAALSMRGHPSPAAFIRRFPGNSQFVFDFLTEEVLSRQPDEIRQFLTRTSILSQFSAPLGQAVAGSAHAAEIIDILERENLFVIPLDDTRQWFRYCRLFAQVLRGELARTEPEIVPALHERASAWYRRSGSADEAISHAHAAGDVAGAVSLIAGNWPAYVDSGQVATVRGWLSPLGDSGISADPVAAHCAAWAAALSGDHESLRRWLPVIEAAQDDGPLPDGIRSLRSSAALLKGTFGQEGIGPMREAATEAARLETDPASPWYAMAQASCGVAAFWSGDLDAAAGHAQAAVSGAGSPAAVRLLGHAILSLIAVDQGNPDDVEQHACIAREIMAAADPDLRAAPLATVEILARLDRLEKRLAARSPEVPLTEREVAVLRLLGGTLSQREIGQELRLSQSTIKSHAKAIYRKLDVATRHDAVARGRKIGIL